MNNTPFNTSVQPQVNLAVMQQVNQLFAFAQYYELMLVALNFHLQAHGIVVTVLSLAKCAIVYRDGVKPTESFPTIHQMMERVFEIIADSEKQAGDDVDYRAEYVKCLNLLVRFNIAVTKYIVAHHSGTSDTGRFLKELDELSVDVVQPYVESTRRDDESVD